MKQRNILSLLIGLMLVAGSWWWGGTALAGDPDSGSEPASTVWYSLDDLFHRLAAGTIGTARPFTEPAAGPGLGTMHTINEIMAVAPLMDNTNGATVTQVLTGATYWGLRAGAWGLQTGTGQMAEGNATDSQVLAGRSYSNADGPSTGTMPNNGAGSTIVPTTTVQSLPAGYWSSANTVTGDSDLAADNIRQGVNLFGVEGTAISASGTATDSQVLAGQTYSNAGGPSVGTIPNNGSGSTIVPTSTTRSLAAGYWSSANTVTGDPDLSAENIRQGITLFGVEGTVIRASGTATDTEVLAGRSYANADGPGTGTMPNNGAGSTVVPTTTMQSLAAGYWSSANTITGDPDLAADNIRQGVNLFGVEGTAISASGTATDSQVLAGQTYSNAGGPSVGTIPNNGSGSTIVPTSTTRSLAAGYWSSANTVTGDPDLSAENIRQGITLFGVEGTVIRASGTATDSQVLAGRSYSNAGGPSVGTMPNNGAGSTVVPTTTVQSLAPGYWSSANIIAGDPDLSAGNIRQGVNLFGVEGTVIRASGTATDSQVLAGRSYSNADGPGAGTMPNNGSGSTVVPTTTVQSLAAGYWSSANTITGDPDLSAGNIRQGVDLFGVTGTVIKAEGNATDNQVLAGRNYSNVGGASVGTMPNNGAGSTIVPTSTTRSLASGYWSSANIITGDPDLTADNIRQGITLFGVEGTVIRASGNATDSQVLAGRTYSNDDGPGTGTMPNNGSGSTVVPTTTTRSLAAGYWSSANTVTGDPDLTAGNIRQGVDLFGVTGTVIRASGNATDSQVLAGRSYSNADGPSVGTMPNNGAGGTIVPTTTTRSLAPGYWSSANTVAGDPDLTADNIRQGVDLFGVAGTLTSGDTFQSGVPKTGQTLSYVVGDDGHLKSGLSWPNPRFTDNGDGTVTDNLTGLIWLKNAACFGTKTWAEALQAANGLADGSCGLSDGSAAGDWHLPNVKEMQSLLSYGYTGPAIPNTAGTGQWTAGDPFTNVQSWKYWTSNTNSTGASQAFQVDLTYGATVYNDKSYYSQHLWPVRGGGQ